MDLTEFLLARIDEDEAAAQTLISTAKYDGVPDHFSYFWDTDGKDAEWSDHFGRWEPERVLVECAAKRRLINEIKALDTELSGFPFGQPWRLLHTLAIPYVDHPDFDPAWAV